VELEGKHHIDQNIKSVAVNAWEKNAEEMDVQNRCNICENTKKAIITGGNNAAVTLLYYISTYTKPHTSRSCGRKKGKFAIYF
jgi:hypothetical protein